MKVKRRAIKKMWRMLDKEVEIIETSTDAYHLTNAKMRARGMAQVMALVLGRPVAGPSAFVTAVRI